MRMPVTGARAGTVEPGVGYAGAAPGKRRKLKRRVRLGRTSDREAKKTWEKLRERPVMGIMADSVGITSGVDAGLTGGVSGKSAKRKARRDRLAATPAKPSERIRGSRVNAEGSAGSASSGAGIKIAAAIEASLEQKAKDHNAKMTEQGKPAWSKTSAGALKSVWRRGAGAFSVSHRPNMSRQQWAMGRVNAFLKILEGGKPKNRRYVGDNDLLPEGHPWKSRDKIQEKGFRPFVPRTSDPDTYTNAESARIRARQIGCVGIRRYTSVEGQTVWQPCTTDIQYQRMMGFGPFRGQGPAAAERRIRRVVRDELGRKDDAKALRGLRRTGRVVFDRAAMDADGDGLVQDGTAFERPALPNLGAGMESRTPSGLILPGAGGGPLSRQNRDLLDKMSEIETLVTSAFGEIRSEQDATDAISEAFPRMGTVRLSFLDADNPAPVEVAQVQALLHFAMIDPRGASFLQSLTAFGNVPTVSGGAYAGVVTTSLSGANAILRMDLHPRHSRSMGGVVPDKKRSGWGEQRAFEMIQQGAMRDASKFYAMYVASHEASHVAHIGRLLEDLGWDYDAENAIEAIGGASGVPIDDVYNDFENTMTALMLEGMPEDEAANRAFVDTARKYFQKIEELYWERWYDGLSEELRRKLEGQYFGQVSGYAKKDKFEGVAERHSLDIFGGSVSANTGWDALSDYLKKSAQRESRVVSDGKNVYLHFCDGLMPEGDEVEQKSLVKLPGFGKKPKPAVVNPKAEDRDGDGFVQDGTTAQRPATKPVVEAAKEVIEWSEPMLGKQMVNRPRNTKSALWIPKAKRFVKERRRFHRRIVADHLKRAGKPKPDGQGRVVFMGGGPASRKSSALDAGLIADVDGVLKVDPDTLKNYLPEYRAWVEDGVPEAAAHVHQEAKHVSELVNWALVEEGHDFILDTTGDGSYSKLKARLEGLRRKGHKIEAHYMTNSIETAMKLNDERFKQTKRKVSTGDLLHMHRQVSQNVPKAIEDGLFDEFHLYDTEDLDADPVEIARKMPGGELEILDEEKWQRFLDKGKPPPPPPKPLGPSKPGKKPKPWKNASLFADDSDQALFDWMSSIYDDYEPQSDILGEPVDPKPASAYAKPLPGFSQRGKRR